MVTGRSYRSGNWGLNPAPTTVGISHGYQRSMQYSYASAGGGFGLLLTSDWAVICSAKLLRSYMLADFITRYINQLILLFFYYMGTYG